MSFEEATTVFDDRSAVIRDDRDHSLGEFREVIIGSSNEHQLRLVSLTERNDVIRLISAKAATKREQKLYEEIRR